MAQRKLGPVHGLGASLGALVLSFACQNEPGGDHVAAKPTGGTSGDGPGGVSGFGGRVGMGASMDQDSGGHAGTSAMGGARTSGGSPNLGGDAGSSTGDGAGAPGTGGWIEYC